MSFQIEQVTEEFDRLAAAPMPPSTVDVALARQRGRRKLRLRHAAQAMTATVSAIALAAGVFVAVGQSGGPGQTTNGTAVDPLTVGASYGWLPTGFEVESYNLVASDTNTSTVTATDPVTRHSTLDLIAYMAGNVLPAAPSTDQAAYVGTLNDNPVYMQFIAPPVVVNTRPTQSSTPPFVESTPSGVSGSTRVTTYTYVGAGAGIITLTWRSPVRGWAQLRYNYPDQTANLPIQTLLQIAGTVSFKATPVSLPFSVGGLSHSTVHHADLQVGVGHGTGNVTTVELNVDVAGTGVTIHASTDATPVQSNNPVSSRADGEINGLYYTVQIIPYTKGAETPVEIGDAHQVLDRIVGHGPDPTDWTTNVLTP